MKNKPIEPSRPVTFVSPFPERNQAVTQLNEAVQKILHPRNTTSFGGAQHFLPVPPASLAKITRGGQPGEPDDRERQRFQEELQVIGLKEHELKNLAGQARNVISGLDGWNAAVTTREEPFVIASAAGAFSDADLEDLAA